MSRFQEDGTHHPRCAGREVGPGKRAPYRDFLIEILTPTPDITRVEMSEALMENFGISASLPEEGFGCILAFASDPDSVISSLQFCDCCHNVCTMCAVSVRKCDIYGETAVKYGKFILY